MALKALITGITGQDGSYLAEFLLDRDYEIHGVVRRTSLSRLNRIEHLLAGSNSKKIHLHSADLSDANSITKVLYDIKPDEIYHLGAQSDVGLSFTQPIYTADVTALSTLRLLESIRQLNLKTRFYQAGSSELFGAVSEAPQNEKTPFNPVSPYAVSKAFSHSTVRCYRKSYNLFATNGILFNHESPRRGENFVTRKITKAAARIKLGLQEKLLLGNLDAKRDWGYAKDYVKAMWLMLQHEQPDDFVIATNETHSVREFLSEAFATLDLEWREYVKIDPSCIRPSEVSLLIGDYSKAKKVLGWAPTTTFKELVKMMVEADLQAEKFQMEARGVEPLTSGLQSRRSPS